MDANGGAKTATPWGAARLVDELTLPQRAGDKRFASNLRQLEPEHLRANLRDLLVAHTGLAGGLLDQRPVLGEETLGTGSGGKIIATQGLGGFSRTPDHQNPDDADDAGGEGDQKQAEGGAHEGLYRQTGTTSPAKISPVSQGAALRSPPCMSNRSPASPCCAWRD